MGPSLECEQKVLTALEVFLESTGRSEVILTDRTNLVGDLGFSSDEGVDFVLDLCEVFKFDFPHEFNPVVHPSGRRGRRVGELIDAVASCLSREEAVS